MLISVLMVLIFIMVLYGFELYCDDWYKENEKQIKNEFKAYNLAVRTTLSPMYQIYRRSNGVITASTSQMLGIQFYLICRKLQKKTVEEVLSKHFIAESIKAEKKFNKEQKKKDRKKPFKIKG